MAKWHVRRTSGAPKALVVALGFCRLLGLGCPKQAFAKIATPRFLEGFSNVRWDGEPTYKIEQVPFLLFSCSSFFSIAWQSSELFFLHSALQTSEFRFWLFLNPLVFRQAYFFNTHLGKHQDLLLLFHRLMFSTSALAFSHRTLMHNTQFPFFQQGIYFPLIALKKKKITRGSPAFFSRGGAPCYPGERSESWITMN